jgi:hypothetical protein
VKKLIQSPTTITITMVLLAAIPKTKIKTGIITVTPTLIKQVR